MKNVNTYFQIAILGAFLMLPGCDKEVPSAPTGLAQVTTSLVSGIFDRSAKGGGVVTSDGGQPVTTRGICWSVSPAPTIAGDKDEEGAGLGNFDAYLYGLTGSTEYHVRAFATNSFGTAYGEEVTFKTKPPPPPPITGSVSDRQGNNYRTRLIGTQNWMIDNLKAKIFADASDVPFMRGSPWYTLTTPAFCWVNNDDSRTLFYGELYNFYAVVDARNVCPPGWHVPSIDEWDAMITSLGGEAVAGGQMKEIGTAHWTAPNLGATNLSGFTGLPAGNRNQLNFNDFLISGYFWSSTSLESDFGVMYSLRYSTADVRADQYPKTAGASIRCVEN